MKQLASQNVLINYARFRQGLDQAGSTPAGYKTFVIPGSNCSGFWWRGRQVIRNDLLVFPDSNELQSASYEDFEVFTISLRISYPEQLIDNLGFNRRCIGNVEVIRLNGPDADGLRNQVGTIVRSAGDVLTKAAIHGLAERLTICAAQTDPGKSNSLRQRDLAVDRVTEYLRITQVPTSELAELCRLARVSERTLQYAFKERYKIPPNIFVKRWKLNSARRLLQQAGSLETSVTDVASRLGFLHLGEFAADYRKLFAELPSTTLAS